MTKHEVISLASRNNRDICHLQNAMKYQLILRILFVKQFAFCGEERRKVPQYVTEEKVSMSSGISFSKFAYDHRMKWLPQIETIVTCAWT